MAAGSSLSQGVDRHIAMNLYLVYEEYCRAGLVKLSLVFNFYYFNRAKRTTIIRLVALLTTVAMHVIRKIP